MRIFVAALAAGALAAGTLAAGQAGAAIPIASFTAVSPIQLQWTLSSFGLGSLDTVGPADVLFSFRALGPSDQTTEPAIYAALHDPDLAAASPLPATLSLHATSSSPFFVGEAPVDGTLSITYSGPGFTAHGITFSTGQLLLSQTFAGQAIGPQSFAISNAPYNIPVAPGTICCQPFTAFSDIAADGPQASATQSLTSHILSGVFGAATPEPATWTLMVGGFGLVGATARRRRRTETLA